MTSINLQLPDDVKARLERRAAEQGYAGIEAYIEFLVREDAECPQFGAPAEVSFDSHAEFEQKMLEGLASPSREMSDADWEGMRARFMERQGRKGP